MSTSSGTKPCTPVIAGRDDVEDRRVPITQANSAKKRLTKLLRQCTHHKSGIPSFQLRNPRAGHTLGGLSLLLHRQVA